MYQCTVLGGLQQLLNYEPRAEEQVPLLMTLHEDELALVKAVESGDTDLSMSIVRHSANALNVFNTQSLEELKTRR